MQVAYAENQSMFLDSLMGDGEWVSRYSVSRCADFDTPGTIYGSFRWNFFI